MKKKNIIMIILLVSGLILIGVGLLFSDSKNPVDDVPKNEKIYKYNTLFELADELYLDKSYLKLPKNENGVYYMTIGEYKKRGFKQELIDLSCPDDFGILYFDVENKDKYNKNPLYVVYSCKKNEDVSKLLDLAKNIYVDNAYLDLPQDSGGIYYMTIAEYKRRGYSLDLLIDANCPDDTGVIFFDVFAKDMYDEDSAPVFISTCE